MSKNLLTLFLAVVFLLPSAAFAQTAVKITAQEKMMADAITASQLKDYLYFVASDEMEGRDTPSRGLDLTAKFIALNLNRWGFKPAGDDGTFFQKIALKSEAIDADKTALQIGDQKYQLNEDFFRIAGSANGSAANVPLVFGGNGWMVKSKNIDALQTVDVKGKIVVLYSEGPNPRTLTQMPKDVTPADLSGTEGTDWADPMTNARAKGAAGIIVVATPQLQGFWAQLKQMLSGESMYPEKLREAAAVSPTDNFSVFLVSQKVGNAIFAGESSDKTSAASFAINKSGTMNLVSRSGTKFTQNVVAVWEGSDAKLKSEMVAIGAHYDHVGINPNAPGEDKIFNGADDDGSGTVAVLSIAEALSKAKTRPKRSVLFVWHAGEEKGLWGSEYFNKFPTVDIKSVIAHLNIDMIGRSKKAGDADPKNKDLSGENEIYVIGAEMMSSTLGAVTKDTNSGYLNLSYNYRYDDPKDPNRFFFRSDHFNYALNNIPVAFWFDGEHVDYHGAGDHADKIDYARMEKITRTIFLTLWELTDLKERPKVDKQLPPELTRR